MNGRDAVSTTQSSAVSPFKTTFGAYLVAENKARFALWAPDAELVSVEIVGQGTLPMEDKGEGRFELEVSCRANVRYRYLIGDELSVPDPASRAQDGDIDGDSILVDSAHYQWQQTRWRGRPWTETVIYELHVGALGGFEGVRKRLPEIAALGVTAIELMPINEFPGARNWGYDGVLPYAVEASYGTPDDLKALIDEAHKYKLMVFLDVVYNHFGPDGNYLFEYAKAFFRDDVHTPWGPAIDFRRAEVRSFFIDNALMWLQEYRFDGLRFDAVHAITEQDFLTEMAARIHAAIAPDRHVHLMLENEHNTASLLEKSFDAQWNDDGHNVLHALLTGEREAYYADYCADATAKLARCLSEGFIYQGQHTRRGKPRGEPSGHLSPTAFVLFLQNHDQIGNRAMGERLTRLTDPDALRAATTLLLLSPMIPLLFMGDDWGSKQPFLFFTDHKQELAEAVREGRRSEFADFAAFADEKSRAAIPDPNAEATFMASIPDFDHAESGEHALWRSFYRTLLALRHDEIVPRLDGARFGKADILGEGAIVVTWQLGDGSLLTIALNIGKSTVALPNMTGRRLFDSNDDDDDKAFFNSPELSPCRALVWLETTTPQR